MHQKQPIDRSIGEWQIELLDESRERWPRRGPFHNALRSRHEGEAPLGFFAEEPQIGCRVSKSRDAQPARIRPARSDAAAHKAARNRAQGLSVEVAQVDDVEKQSGSSARSWDNYRCANGVV
jgi:hypothetical protein